MIPEISLIMPVYNAENFILEAVTSILKQTFRNFELIIIDDGSTDNSYKICCEFSKSDNRVKIKKTDNQGICKARNLGLKLANGKYIGFVDHDDILDENLLLDNYRLIKDNNADWIKFGKIEHIVYKDKTINKKQSNFENRILINNEIKLNLFTLRKQGVLTYVWDSLFSKDIIEKLNLSFDEYFRYGNEDIDFCQRYVEGANKLIINSKNYYHHFTRLGVSTSSKFSIEKLKSHIYLAEKSLHIYEKYGVDIEEDNYIFLLTRYVIFNVIKDLNIDSINIKDKVTILKSLKIEKLFVEKKGLKKYLVFRTNPLLGGYYILYINHLFRPLFYLDMYSRKLIYNTRFIKSFLKENNGEN